VLALVYSRNHRVTAALGLVSTWEDFKAETAEELARIPQLEKQAKTLREQLNNTNGVLTETEIKVTRTNIAGVIFQFLCYTSI
jgi:hypothetical protein